MSSTDEQITEREVTVRRRFRRAATNRPATATYFEAVYIPSGTADLWRSRRRDARR